MPTHDQVQATFSGGEISPRLHGRVDSELYRKALKFCSGWEPMPHGGLRMRRGSQFKAMPADLTKDCRLFEFPVAGESSRLLVLGGGALRAYNAKGVVGQGQRNLLHNPTFRYAFDYWDIDWLFVEAGQFYMAYKPPSIGTNRLHQAFDAEAGDYTVRVQAVVQPGDTLHVMVGSTAGGHELLDADVTGESYEGTVTISSPGTYHITLVCTGSVWTTTAKGALWVARLTEVSVLAESSGDVEFTGASYPWTDAQLGAVQAVADASNNRAIFVHPDVAPWELQYDATTGSWTFAEITFTSQPAEWTTGAYPSAAELYQGRLWLGGVAGHHNTFWASKSGSIYDFTLGANAADAISLDISTKGAIEWFQGHRQLLCGTDRGEYSIVGSQGVVTPSDFNVRPESAFGSASIQGINIGEVAVYVTRDRRKLRVLSYNLQENGYQNRDLTFVAEHITADLVREVHWAPDPNDTVVVVLQSGLLACCVFNRAEEVAAWWRLDLGQVYSAAIVSGPSGSEVWMLVQRDSGVCLEVLPMHEEEGAAYLDSHVTATLSYVNGVATVAGLDHLEGEEVSVVLDGNLLLADRVVSGGEVTVTEEGERVAVGLRYRATAIKLPLEGGNPKGSAIGAKRRYTRIGLRLNDSALPLINGTRPFPDRSPSTPMDTVEARVTADVRTNLVGWDDAGAITIEQDLPLRTEILAIFGTVAVNEV